MSAIASERLERILPTVERPGRYTGGEFNSVVKDWVTTAVRLALCYPDVYEIGMSNLGLAILYDLVNKRPSALAERAYTPWPDMAAALRRAGLPLYSLETHHPLADFDVVGFTLQYELNYTNVLEMLDLAGIPLHSAARSEAHPLVIAGGSSTYNPEPMAAFFDLFVIGEGEEVLLELLDLVLAMRGQPRAELLRRAAEIPGIYVPGLYQVDYDLAGRVLAVTPSDTGVPERVTKRIMPCLPPPVTRPVVPFLDIVHDRANVEIQRGCTEGCRFCQAGMIYRPVRERRPEEVMDAVEQVLANTGYDEVGLVSLASSDYSQIEPLLEALVRRWAPEHVSFGLPSLRVDAFSVRLAGMVQATRKTGLTFAPEAGSERLRAVINKNVTEDDLVQTAEAAYSAGWDRIKLYFMLGLPTESDEDVEAIARLVHRVADIGRRHRGGRAKVHASASTFVPKPHSPFQWLPLADLDTVQRRQRLLHERLRRRGVQFDWTEPRTTLLEAALSRGDRRVGAAVEAAWRGGAVFDAWGEHFKPALWQEAFAASGLDMHWYASRQRALDEVLPWEHINVGVKREFLAAEWERATSGEPTPDCRDGCQRCGLLEAFRAERKAVAKGVWQCP
ncbi:MAG TPA: TIGR03960 family B12-binding radical SAM protein [Anaerolineae bacterium]|nr:TIGR03960 family B12-binding radical SAM protein [Anaerolineae bacterium]HOR01342.1 TIGR03960 family B12-binding radical SAM protein [Anaerolineae bacterium]HPL26892.1 TIGR03960 family B12-binding radical SAM protein [Anaerolineae bacterium]HPL26903.1 TIGR03960 family B12-binding radical SAM protein [Anaerolineae bacterium]